MFVFARRMRLTSKYRKGKVAARLWSPLAMRLTVTNPTAPLGEVTPSTVSDLER